MTNKLTFKDGFRFALGQYAANLVIGLTALTIVIVVVASFVAVRLLVR